MVLCQERRRVRKQCLRRLLVQNASKRENPIPANSAEVSVAPRLDLIYLLWNTIHMDIPNQTLQSQQKANPILALISKFSKTKVSPIIIMATVIIIVAIGSYILGTKQNKPPVSSIIQQTSIPTPTLSPAETLAKDDQTSTWIMYPDKVRDGIIYSSRNPRYSFSYPPDWKFQSMSGECGPVFGPSDGKYGFTICGPYLNTETPEILAKEERGEKSVISLSNIIVDNHRGIKQELEYLVNEENKNYRNVISIYVADVQVALTDALNGEQVQTTGTIAISFEGSDRKLTEEERRKFDQILSTFKFTDRNKTLNMSNWKTFTSAQLQGNSLKAYSIKYPGSWELKKETDSVEFHNLTLSRVGYSISVRQADFSGAGCIFEDEVPEGSYNDYINKKYTQIESSIGLLRRFESDVSSPNLVTFDFCASENGKDYSSITQVGTIAYETPKAYKQSVIDEMDSIITTINPL